MAAKKNKLCERVRSTFGEVRVFERGYVSKKQGLNYVKWSYALECLKAAFPDSDVSWREWDGLDHLLYPSGSAIVEAIITIRDGGEELVTKFPLPVLDYRNKAIENPNAMDVNTAKMRAFVKAMGTLGFGLNVYHGHEGDGIADGEASARMANPADAIKDLKKACDDEGLDFGLVEDFVQMKRGALITELNSADIAGLKARVMNEKDKFRKDK